MSGALERQEKHAEQNRTGEDRTWKETRGHLIGLGPHLRGQHLQGISMIAQQLRQNHWDQCVELQKQIQAQELKGAEGGW